MPPRAGVAQFDPLRVEVFVSASFHGQVRAGMMGEVTPEAPLAGPFRAVVTVVDLVMDSASGTFGVRLSLPNAALALPAGIRCSVRFADPAPR